MTAACCAVCSRCVWFIKPPGCHSVWVFSSFLGAGFPGAPTLLNVAVSHQAIQLSRDGQYLLTGGDSGVLMVWQVSDLKQLFAYPGCDAGIRAMALSYDQR